jgi:hypothetical protein
MADEIDYSEFTTVKAVDEEIQKRKDSVCRKVKHQQQLVADKKDTVKSYNDQIKEVKAKVEEELAILDGLAAQRKLLEKKL